MLEFPGQHLFLVVQQNLLRKVIRTKLKYISLFNALNSQSCLQHWQRLFPVEKLKQLSLLKLNPLWHRGGNFFLHNNTKTQTDQRVLVFQLVKITHFAFNFMMDFCQDVKFCVSACFLCVVFYAMSPHTFPVISWGSRTMICLYNYPFPFKESFFLSFFFIISLPS